MMALRKSLATVLCTALLALAPGAGAFATVDDRVSLDVQGVSLADVLRLIALQAQANIVTDQSVNDIRVTTRLEHLHFAQALSVLEHAYGLVVKHEDGVIIVSTAAAVRKHNDDLAVDDERVTSVKLRYARASDAAKQIATFLPAKNFTTDINQNTIILVGSGPAINRAQAALRAIDIRNQQVRFEVKVVDVSVNDNSNIGTVFGGSPSAPGTTATTFATSAIPLSATLNAMVSEGKAKVLATPRIVTTNNTEASLLIGESYPLVTTTVTNGTATQQVQYLDVGVILRVTPTIGSDGSILADLHPQYSTFQDTSTQGYPIISNRRVDATLRVNDGESIVLAGLLQDIDQSTVTKFPILGDLPILGPVFRNRNHLHQRDEVVFIITPHVM